MLVEFSVGNYLSFNETVTFSMVTDSINEHLETNTFQSYKNLRLINTSSIYGANASGKSNLIKAMRFMRGYVLNFFKTTQTTDVIPVENFKLSSECDSKPSYFEIIFIQNNHRFRYGFEVNTKEVFSEWLYYVPVKKEVELFFRTGDKITINATYFSEAKGLKKFLRHNAPFISVVDQFNGKLSSEVMKWFIQFNIISGLDDFGYAPFTMQKLHENKKFKALVEEFLKIADLGIHGLVLDTKKTTLKNFKGKLLVNPKTTPEDKEVFQTQIFTLHKKYSGKKSKLVPFIFDKYESEGTKKFFWILGPLIDTLMNGKILVIDELDSRLHPELTETIIKLFHSPLKKGSAQLIFTTHDVNLLSNKNFRRDQICFVEKNKFEASELYSLSDIKKGKERVRNDASYGKDYLLGRYGAVPEIGDIDKFLKKLK